MKLKEDMKEEITDAQINQHGTGEAELNAVETNSERRETEIAETEVVGTDSPKPNLR